jgi:hypothetical protein
MTGTYLLDASALWRMTRESETGYRWREQRPGIAEIVARAQTRAKATGSTVTMSDAVAAVRNERDRHDS